MLTRQAKRTQRRKKAFYTRSFAVFLLFLTVLMLSVSGLVLYVAPPGRYANFSGWQVLAIDKGGWEAIHTNFSWIFLIIISLHTYFNWRVIRGYLRRGVNWTVRYRRELGAATATTLLVFAGTLRGWPPFSSVMTFGESVKRYWETNGITVIGNPWMVVSLIITLLAGWGLLVMLKARPEKEMTK